MSDQLAAAAHAFSTGHKDMVVCKSNVLSERLCDYTLDITKQNEPSLHTSPTPIEPHTISIETIASLTHDAFQQADDDHHSCAAEVLHQTAYAHQTTAIPTPSVFSSKGLARQTTYETPLNLSHQLQTSLLRYFIKHLICNQFNKILT